MAVPSAIISSDEGDGGQPSPFSAQNVAIFSITLTLRPGITTSILVQRGGQALHIIGEVFAHQRQFHPGQALKGRTAICASTLV
jgi:hypothetical protein